MLLYTNMNILHGKKKIMSNCVLTDSMKCKGGMQDNNKNNRSDINEKDRTYAKEIKTLVRLFGDSINEEELRQKIEYHSGNIELVIKELVQQILIMNIYLYMHIKHKLEAEPKTNELEEKTEQVIYKNHFICFCITYFKQEQGNTMNEINNNNKSVQKEMEITEIGETKPGINLQGYCINENCLASKAKLPVWINIGFYNITFVSDKTSFSCPDCKKSTVNLIAKAMFYNSEHSICANGSIPVKDNNYQSLYTIKPGLSYKLTANKVRQHAKNIEDLRERSEHAMDSIEINNLVTELQKYEITVVKPPSLKGNERLLEKIQADYGGDFNQVFDIGRFTILCDNSTKLQTAVAVMKKAEQFNLIVSEDKDFFEKKSKTHHRFHNIRLYVPKHDVYIEMQATLKNFTTLEGYTVIENPNLSHLFYEHIRAWKPNNPLEEELKQASDETLTKINDVICEWIDAKEIKKIANRYKPHSEIRILKPPQLKGINEEEVNAKNDIPLKLIKFVYDQLCKFNPKEMKGQAVYVLSFEYFKKHIMGEMNPASCVDVISILKESRKQELEEDTTVLQALEMYIPLQANNYPYTDNDDKNNNSYDCHQHIIDFLEEEKKEKKSEQVAVLQGKSGSGKSLFCRHLEGVLWESYVNGLTTFIPICISLPKCYSELNEKQIISQALQMKQINKEIIDVICENISFVFILDGFDEIFDKYNRNKNNERYFYDRFNLCEWNAKIIVTCRSHVLNDEDIQHVLIGSKNITTTSMIYLWPFSKGQMNGYIDKFVKMNKKNKINDNLDWTVQKYEETLKHFPNLNKMMEEPFLLRMILTVLPSLMKQHPIGTKISKAQIYEAFNEQWIDIYVKNIVNKLSELRIQTNLKKIKAAFQQYCQDLAFEMFIQGNQVATENDYKENENDNISSKLDPIIEIETKHTDEKLEPKVNNTKISVEKTQDIWKQYFNGDSIAKYVLRKVSGNKYQFLHKSCQEYFAAQKIIFDIISWKPSAVNINNQQFQQQFEMHAQQFLINRKLLNEEMGIILFIANRIYDDNLLFVNLKSRLFRLIESSKTNSNVSIAAANAATILNMARVSMSHQNWDKINISHAILDYGFLEGTSFKGAVLDNVSFFRACLSYTNFTNASVNQVNFGEYGYLKGHSDCVTSVQFSPDGNRIVSGSEDNTIRLWDALSGKQIQCFEDHTGEVTSVQFSPDGKRIVSGSYDNTVRLWDVSSGQQIQCFEGHTDCVVSVQFSPSGDKIISGSFDNTIRLWDPLSGKQIQSLEGHTNIVTSVHFSHDGNQIVSGSDDQTIRLWSTSSGKQIQCFEGHNGNVTSVTFSPDCNRIVSGSSDKTIRLWDVSSGKQIQSIEGHSGHVLSVQFSPDGNRIVSGSFDKTIRLWDVSSGKQVQSFEGHSGHVLSVQFSPDGNKLVSGSYDETIRLWDVSLKIQTQSLEVHSRIVNSVQFSPDGSKIVSGSDDKTIRLWNASSGLQIQSLEGHSDCVTSAQFSPDGGKILSVSVDHSIRLWDVTSGKQIQFFDIESFFVRSFQFSPNGDRIVFGSFDGIIRLLDLSSGKQIQCFEGHTKGITSVNFSPDGGRIVSGSHDKIIHLWDISGKRIQSFEGHTNTITFVQFSHDSNRIVSGSDDKTIRLWDTSSGKQIQCFEGHTKDVTSVRFSPDRNRIVSSSKDKTIRLWDIQSGQQIQSIEGHSDHVTSVQFSPDGNRILSASGDSTIRLYSNSSNLIHFTSDDKKSVCSQNERISLWKCIWQGGVQRSGLSLRDSTWKDAKGLTLLQMSVVEQYGGTF
ncbi:WD-40 repeat protein [Reticulomyxa filosa]|uniref:WD-40 repeat protein n=1 Tax=Reticulomyxa filosa TaxID=46433 RepID=X6P1R7_RETFI|nr:WD-40 repeat protein [Reticulomyxa filosa]|eukprot:ETO32083.1 WD-40 repeat protein [Reticulomyxa filosa]